jgi:hypothetical protein
VDKALLIGVALALIAFVGSLLNDLPSFWPMLAATLGVGCALSLALSRSGLSKWRRATVRAGVSPTAVAAEQEDGINEGDPASLLTHAERLTCCLMFEGPERRTSAGGSAIFIAPRLALTARHLTDEGFTFLGERRSTKVGQAEKSEHGIRLFQQSADGNPPFGLWSPCHEWRTETTDISLLLVPNEQSCGDSTLPMPKDFLSWSLMPPPVGERVRLLGYPLSSGSYEGDSLVCTAYPTPLEATVTAVYSPWRQRVKYDFPCFEIDVNVNQGFSGGGCLGRGSSAE